MKTVDTEVLMTGSEPQKAKAALLMIHGRGASAQSMLWLFEALSLTDFCAVAPQAPDGSWYPFSFLAPMEKNQPGLDFGLDAISGCLARLRSVGLVESQVSLLGFSQGACLLSEFIARNPAAYRSVAVLTGGIQGPLDEERRFAGSFPDTSILMTTGVPDFHIPVERFNQTVKLFEGMGAQVSAHHFKDKPHSISEEELELCRRHLGGAE